MINTDGLKNDQEGRPAYEYLTYHERTGTFAVDGLAACHRHSAECSTMVAACTDRVNSLFDTENG